MVIAIGWMGLVKRPTPCISRVYHGCFFHGCPTCHARGDRVKHPRTGQSMSELYALTIKKEASLKKLGYKYICKWDHQFRKEMSDNLDLSKFVKALNVMPRLNPRDSFF